MQVTDTPSEREERGAGKEPRRHRVLLFSVFVAIGAVPFILPVLNAPEAVQKVAFVGRILVFSLILPFALWHGWRERRRRGLAVFATGVPVPGDLWSWLQHSSVPKWGLVAALVITITVEQLIELGVRELNWPARVEHIPEVLLLIGLPVALILACYHVEVGQRRVSFAESALLALAGGLGGAAFWFCYRYVEPGAVVESGVTTLTGLLLGLQRVLRKRRMVALEEHRAQGTLTGDERFDHWMFVANGVLVGGIVMPIAMFFNDSDSFLGNLSVSTVTALALIVAANGPLMRRFVSDGYPKGPLIFVLLVSVPVFVFEAAYRGFLILQHTSEGEFTAMRHALVLLGVLVYAGVDWLDWVRTGQRRASAESVPS
jgi:hypothetical protein